MVLSKITLKNKKFKRTSPTVYTTTYCCQKKFQIVTAIKGKDSVDLSDSKKTEWTKERERGKRILLKQG